MTSELEHATVAPYTVAKGGIKTLTRATAAKWAGNGIQTNAIGLSRMLTNINQALVNELSFNPWVSGRPLARRWGKLDELVGAAIFPGSAASDYVNGQITYVDSGTLAAR